MTEAEWLNAEMPSKLLCYIRRANDTSDRKQRLFAVVCCRRVLDHIPDITLLEVIDWCECLAEQLDSDNWKTTHLHKLQELNNRVSRCTGDLLSDGAVSDIEYREFVLAVHQLVEFPIYPEHCADSCMSALCGHDDYETGRGEVLFQIDLLRDIFGNPFRPVTVDPSWLTSTVLSLAQGIYADRAFDRMPILGDALQDAGCDNEDILNHCRRPGEHVRGCWVVDLILGKS